MVNRIRNLFIVVHFINSPEQSNTSLDYGKATNLVKR